MGSKPLDGSTSLSPTPKDAVQEALGFRRGGYVVKTMAEGDLLTGVENGLSVALKQAAILVPD